MKTLVGILLVVAHAAALPLVVARCRRPELAVALDERGAVVTPARAETITAPVAPGLARTRWRVTYRGGFVREVGAAELVGPFQDPAAPACGARLVVGQRFLTDAVAPAIRDALAAELRGFTQWPAGAFRRVGAVEVRWTRFDDAADPGLFGELLPTGALAALWRTDGYARVRAAVVLDRVTADVVVALVPRVDGARVSFGIFARADLTTGNAALDWALDTVRADAYATEVIRDELDDAILAAFDPPPPLALPGGRALRVAYCPGAHLAVASDGWAALPLALAFAGRPVALGGARPAPPDPDVDLAFELDLDTVNALLDELWRTGYLDEELAAAGLDRRFNDDPTVASLLTLRVSPLRLARPPVVTPAPEGGLRLAADLRADLGDRGRVTPARIWAELALDLEPASTEVALADLALSCEPRPGLLVPCYGDLVAAMRAQAGDARAELSAVLVDLLAELFTDRRVSAPNAPVELVLAAPRITAHPAPPSGTVRIAVDARLESR